MSLSPLKQLAKGYVSRGQGQIVVTETAVNQAAESMILANCRKHEISREDFPADRVEEARQIVRREMEAEAELKSNPLYARVQAAEEAARLAKMELAAVKQTRIAPNNDVKPVADVARVRGLMGERDWHALTDSGRLAACGISQVSAVERQQCKELFGRGCDSHHANDFFKSNAGEYRRLKNIAIVLGIQGQ